MAADAPRSGLPPGAVIPRPRTERGRRWFLRPSAYVLVLVCFTLPFLTVSCTEPGGYGRVEAGGTTSYSGLDLAFAGEPQRSRDHLLPAALQRDDVLTVQPLLWIVLLCVLTGLVISLVVRRAADQERLSALAAALGLLALVGAGRVGHGVLAERVAADALARRVRLDDPSGSYVGSGQGLVLAVLLLLGVLVVEVVLLNARRRGPTRPAERRDRGGGDQRDGTDPVRPDGSGIAASDAVPVRQIGSPWEIELPAPGAPTAAEVPGSPSTPRDPGNASR